MCGIAGIVDLKGRAVEQPLLERLCADLAHRGPDDEGFHVDRNVALGQRRLSIIDLYSGRQPMGNEDGTVWVTFNGEIYNFLELRARAGGIRTPLRHPERHRGHRPRLRAVWDELPGAVPRHVRLRDLGPAGGDSCSWSVTGSARSLCSTRRRTASSCSPPSSRPCSQHPGVRRELDPAALDEYLTYGYIPAPRTAFRNVFKLPPAHFLTLELPEQGVGTADPKVEPYWRLDYTPKLELDEDEAAEGLLEVLTEAVRLRLIADVPLGALLSGGVDSSVVVALMSGLSDRPVKTFSIGFDEKAFNELPYARLVARRYGTDHHELIVRARALDVLPTLVRHYGEPFADSSAIPSYYVAQLTRQHVTVALNGDGGDECFAGYERYLGSGLAERYQRIPRPVRVGMIEPLAALIPGTLPRRNRLSQAKRFLQVAAQPAARRDLRWVTYVTPEQKQGLYTPEFQAQLGGDEGGAWLLDQFADVRRGAAIISTPFWPRTSGRTCPTTCWSRWTSRRWPTRWRPARRFWTTRSWSSPPGCRAATSCAGRR